MQTESPSTESKPRPLLTTIGIVLILLSGVFFFTMLAVPWFPLSVTQKGVVGGGLFVLVQGSWWVGVAMMGPSAIQKIRQTFLE